MNGININFGKGGFITTLLMGGIAMVITNAFVESQNNKLSVNLYGIGGLLIIFAIILYFVVIGIQLTKKQNKRRRW